MTGPLNWEHLDFLEPESLRRLRDESGLPPLVVEALTAGDSRPRAVAFSEGVLVILRGVNLNPGADVEDMISVRVWLEPDRIISTSRRHLRSIADIREAIGDGSGPKTPGEFLEHLADRLNNFIGEVIEQIEADLEQSEDQVDDPGKIARHSPFSILRRKTARIRRYLAPQRDALERVSRISHAALTPEEQIKLHEQANRLVLNLEDIDLVRERAMVAQEEFLGIVAHEQNTRMLLLSIVAAVFLPLSFLTGLMGMNVAGLPGTENTGAFWILVLMMLAVVGVILALFRQRRWL
jgi:zinc transporter